jgi:hypothetical protein
MQRIILASKGFSTEMITEKEVEIVEGKA